MLGWGDDCALECRNLHCHPPCPFLLLPALQHILTEGHSLFPIMAAVEQPIARPALGKRFQPLLAVQAIIASAKVPLVRAFKKFLSMELADGESQ